ncbi:hypothetical protein LTR53_001705, partial [Teratosphaeriaceae sp. CCFEE 6253]
TVKKIPRGAMVVDIRQRDLFAPSRTPGAAEQANADANVASIRLPLRATVASFFDDKYWEVIILSKKI